MSGSVEGFLVNPEVLRSLYGHVPRPEGVRVRSVHLDRRGPTVTLRVDLPGFPASPPPEWAEAGMDGVQCQFAFCAVQPLLCAKWEPPAVADLCAVPFGSERRMRVSVAGTGVDLRFECSTSVVVRHVSAFRRGPGGDDGGPHLFRNKVDARLFGSLPATHRKVFYER
ncbi:Imm50 family immunity protein [Streptomyces sp. NPDC007971]|uniref:Imm50 family immunity protein n=1 Tax=Streptomyces sp. NPDC007971 TaxID=3364799 RepID=UPI0036E5296A